jgi:DNA topoisomerase-3
VAKTLVICEKRSVADDVARALGGRFETEPTRLEGDDLVITWAVGHLAELAHAEEYDPHLKRWRMDDLPIVPDPFLVVPRAEGASAKEQLKAIRALLARRDIDRVVNACDAGREGELIFAYILELARADGRPVERAWFSSMTRAAIREAFAHLRPAEQLRSLEDAARSRAEADWLVGINATRAATVKARALGGTISLGRVQTPTLALMVRREHEIEAFDPVAYWIVDAAFEPAPGDARYLGRWFGGSRTPARPRRSSSASAIARGACASCSGASSVRSRRSCTTSRRSSARPRSGRASRRSARSAPRRSATSRPSSPTRAPPAGTCRATWSTSCARSPGTSAPPPASTATRRATSSSSPRCRSSASSTTRR